MNERRTVDRMDVRGHWADNMPRPDLIDEIESLRARVATDYAALVGHAKDAERLRSQLQGAVEALASLRAAWDEHMKTCPQHAKLPGLSEHLEAWKNAPSNTASGGKCWSVSVLGGRRERD